MCSNTGNLALIEASKQHLNYQKSTLYQSIYDFNTVLRDLKQWTNLDDVIMGGKSSSRWDAVDWKGEGSAFARWSGNVITEVRSQNSYHLLYLHTHLTNCICYVYVRVVASQARCVRTTSSRLILLFMTASLSE